MDAVHADNISIRYLWNLVHEYKLLFQPQLYVLLKRIGVGNRSQRKRLVDGLKKQISIFTPQFCDESYIGSKAYRELTDSQLKTILCFWVLVDYIKSVENHFNSGTFSNISVIISGNDYDIVYVSVGEEKLFLSHIKNSDNVNYIAVIEDTSQIETLINDKVTVFAKVTLHGDIAYYKTDERG